MIKTQGSHCLFNEAYHTAYDKVSNETADAIAACLQDGGLDLRQRFTLDQACEQLRCAPSYRQRVEWALCFLTQQRFLRYREGRWTSAPIAPPTDEFALNVNIEPSLDLIRYVASRWLDIIRGRANPLHVLFGETGFPLWERYFRNSHDLYAAHNQWAAEFIVDEMKEGQKGLSLLELGVGFGSATGALLSECRLSAREIGLYVLTDVSPSLANKLRKSFASSYAHTTFRSQKLDMNRFDERWRGAFDYIFAVNVIHCADHVVETLKTLRGYLKPGGMVVFSECMRKDDQTLLHQEFIFSLLPAFAPIPRKPDAPPCYGFRSPSDWRGFMDEAGYETYKVMVNDAERTRGGLIAGKVGA